MVLLVLLPLLVVVLDTQLQQRQLLLSVVLQQYLQLLQSESVLLEQSVTSTLPMLVWDTLRHQPSPSRHQTKLELEHSRRTKLSLDLFLDLQQEFSIGLPMEENWKSTDQTEILLLGNRLLELLLPQVTNFLLHPIQKLDSQQMRKLKVKQTISSTLLRQIHSGCPNPK